MLNAEKAKAFAEQIRGRDWNRVISLALFSEKGLADLADMIAIHGSEAVEESVLVLLAKSKADRRIPRNHVRSWHFFRPYICKQLERLKENAPCAE